MALSLRHAVERILLKLYSGRVRNISKQLGLHRFMLGIYRKMRSAAIAIEHAISPDFTSVRVKGVEAQIRVRNQGEYRRITIDFPNERESLNRLISDLNSNDVVWDVGANIGVYTCLLAKQVNRGRVIAFEPLSQNVEAIQANVKQNKLENVSIHSIALSNKSGEETLSVTDPKTGVGNASLVRESTDSTSVATIEGDRAVEQGIPSPNVLKIDVEGAELAVLEGLKSTLIEGEISTILCEVHTGYPEITFEAVERKLNRLGYQTEKISTEGQPFIYASKQH